MIAEQVAPGLKDRSDKRKENLEHLNLLFRETSLTLPQCQLITSAAVAEGCEEATKYGATCKCAGGEEEGAKAGACLDYCALACVAGGVFRRAHVDAEAYHRR